MIIRIRTLQKFEKQLKKLSPTLIVMEATGGYELPLHDLKITPNYNLTPTGRDL